MEILLNTLQFVQVTEITIEKIFLNCANVNQFVVYKKSVFLLHIKSKKGF